MSIPRCFALFLLLGMYLSQQLQGSVITAASPALASVTTAVALAKDGDTVVIPAGTSEWSNTLTVTKAITIQGAGVTGLDGTRTIIKDNVPGTTEENSSCFNLQTIAGKSYRITGFEFRNGTRTKRLTKGVIRVVGNSHNIRVDNCKFTLTANRSLTVWDWALGVCDHCDFLAIDAPIHVAHQAWAGGKMGDGSWSSPHTLGTADAWYVEDCTFAPVPGTVSAIGMVDSEFGGRFVVRHCTATNAHQDSHGSEGGADRGTRQFEVYENKFIASAGYSSTGQNRGGSGVYFNNTCTGPWGRFFTLNYYRSRQWYTTWGIADGRNALDNNQPGGPFVSGICTGGHVCGTQPDPTGFDTMQDTSKTWMMDQWAGYIIRNTTTGRASNASSVMHNSSNTITEWPAASQDGMMTFHVGDRYEIWKLHNGLDMPGMGRDDGLNRATLAWPNQTIEGIYSWNNTLNGSRTNVTADKYPFIVEGIHYFNNTQKPGYTPFTYPHPLTGPAPPTDLRIAGP
jgi:hypothetical protein